MPPGRPGGGERARWFESWDDTNAGAGVGPRDPAKEEDELLRMLATVDPNNHSQMTYSDCVATLSTELVAALGRVEGV